LRCALRKRAKTASVIPVSGIPMSSADWEVHFPVPFWAASSTIESTSGPPPASRLSRTSAVIWIR